MTHKAKILRKHAKRRALERFNVDLNSQDLRKIRDMIQAGKAEFLGRETLDRTLWHVNYADRIMKVVYSKRHKTVVTILK